MQSILDWGVAFIISLQSSMGGIVDIANAFTFFGDQEFYLLFLPFLYWTADHRLSLRVCLVFMASVILNEAFKIGFHIPRPYWVTADIELLTRPETTFGFPSGHAQHPAVLWGAIAWWSKNRAVQAGLALFVMMTSLSRWVLGVHFPFDTLASWLIAFGLLWMMVRYGAAMTQWFVAKTRSQQFGTIWGMAVLVIIGAALVSVLTEANFTIPQAWVDNASAVQEEPFEPYSIANFVTIVATVAGVLTGHMWLLDRGGFNPLGPWGKRLGRYIIGLIGVVLLWAGLDQAFTPLAPDASVLGYILRTIRYGLVGMWVGAWAPLLFIRFKLADKATG